MAGNRTSDVPKCAFRFRKKHSTALRRTATDESSFGAAASPNGQPVSAATTAEEELHIHHNKAASPAHSKSQFQTTPQKQLHTPAQSSISKRVVTPITVVDEDVYDRSVFESPSFSRSRAGSSLSKHPPPALVLAQHRKGSLPMPSLAHRENMQHRKPRRLSEIARPTHLKAPSISRPAASPIVDQSKVNVSSTSLNVRDQLLVLSTPTAALPHSMRPPSPLDSEYSVACASSIMSYQPSNRTALTLNKRPESTLKHIVPASEAPSVEPVPEIETNVVHSPRLHVNGQGISLENMSDATNTTLAVPCRSAMSNQSFDLGSVPIMLGPSQTSTRLTMQADLHPVTPALSRHPSTSVYSSTPCGPSPQSPNRRRLTSAARNASRRASSIRSKSDRSVRFRRSTLHSILSAYASSQSTYRQDTQRQSALSAEIRQMLAVPTQTRPFPWKMTNINDAKKQLTPKQLQQIVLNSMREYSSAQDQGLVLEQFEEIPLELEQCAQRTTDLEACLTAEMTYRGSLLKRHTACLTALNGNQGMRFAESLAKAVSRSDRMAQEVCALRKHVNDLERLRDAHWRATASLSMARLNTSYLKAKQTATDAQAEAGRLRDERDSLAQHIEDLQLALTQEREQRRAAEVQLNAIQSAYNDGRASAQAVRREARDHKLYSRRRPTIDTSASPLAHSDYQFPANGAMLPTPPPSDVSRTASPASVHSHNSFLDFADRTLQPLSRASSTPAALDSMSYMLARSGSAAISRRSRSFDNFIELDPRVDVSGSEMETLRFLPPSMHILGAVDEMSASGRPSVDSARS